MQPRKHMKPIQEQKSIEAQSIALDQQSEIGKNSSDVIQQYENLDFSDENSNGLQISNSSDEGELSADKLKFLGVDKFPGPYAQKIRDTSQTRAAYTPSMNMKKHQLMAQSNGYYSRKRRRSQREVNNSFNIDSFLNSRPNNDKLIDYGEKNHTDGFGREIQQQGIKRMTKNHIFPNHFQEKQEYLTKKLKNEQKNLQVRSFIQNYGKEKHHKHNYSQNIILAEDSISLITLPEPQQMKNKQQTDEYKKGGYLKETSKVDGVDSAQRNRIFDVRFQQAKINFLDSFLPQSLKIGSNPYNFLKYTYSKPKNFLRII